MKRKRDLIVTNILSVLVLLGALLAGWWEAAAFGLAVLVIMDLLVLFREWFSRSTRDAEANPDQNGDSVPGSGLDSPDVGPDREK
jgi:hypothetical protein